jgi:hypothetical protein
MGNVAVTVLKKNVRPSGRSALVRLTLSSAYAAGGDTIPIASLGIGNRISALLVSGATNPAGNTVTVIPGASEYAAPKLKCFTPAGVEVTGNQATESVIAEAISTPYK